MDICKLTDKEIFELFFDIPKELENRIINLLKDRNISCRYFKSPETIFEIYDITDGKEYKANAHAIGFATVEKEPEVFVIDEKGRFWWFEDINLESTWDLYKSLKDDLNEPEA